MGLMSVRICLFSIALMLVSSAFAAEKIKIGVLTDGPTEGFQEIQSLFMNEILNLTIGEFDVEFDPSQQLSGNWSIDAIGESFTALQNNNDVDMILANFKRPAVSVHRTYLIIIISRI